MQAVTTVFVTDKIRYAAMFDELPIIGDLIKIKDAGVFRVTERAWLVSDRNIALPALEVEEVEGANIAPSGALGWLERFE